MNLRLWPGVAIAAVILLIRFIAPFLPDGTLLSVLGPLAGGVLIFLWWLLSSRARWTERLGVMAVLIAAGIAAYFMIHPSIREQDKLTRRAQPNNLLNPRYADQFMPAGVSFAPADAPPRARSVASIASSTYAGVRAAFAEQMEEDDGEDDEDV